MAAIPDRNRFYTLYADGPHAWKTYDREKKQTLLFYPPGAVVFLYYTYPTHREACAVRYSGDGAAVAMLPGLSKKTALLFRARASRSDKLKRAAGWLKAHSPVGAFGHGDGFYIRLACLLEQRGKLGYAALRELAERSPALEKQAFPGF
jgi:hypothetical protein